MLSLVVVLAATVNALAHAQALNAGVSDSMQLRCEQAASLKAIADDYVRQAREFHRQADLQIAEAKRLKGEARYLEGITSKSGITTAPLRLSPEQARAAINQYTGDLSQFLGHAQAYNEHMKLFDQQMGRCQANEDRYQASLKVYELHLQQFHLPNLALPTAALSTGLIRPPHICQAMVLSEGEAASVAGRFLSDQAKVLSAERQLARAEADLSASQQAAGMANAKLETEILRGQREKALAVEFGKLKEEYDMLVVERERLASINTRGAFPAARNVSSSITTLKAQGKLVR